MGETFYSLLVALFSNAHNSHLAPEVIVSGALSNLGMFAAFMALTGTLLWFTTKSVLIRSTRLIYLFAAFIGLCGIGHLGHVVMFPLWLQLGVEFVGTVVSLYTAWLTWRVRHRVIAMVYQFKYVIGLLRSLERQEEPVRGDQK